jgi:hypothetical protein
VVAISQRFLATQGGRAAAARLHTAKNEESKGAEKLHNFTSLRTGESVNFFFPLRSTP